MLCETFSITKQLSPHHDLIEQIVNCWASLWVYVVRWCDLVSHSSILIYIVKCIFGWNLLFIHIYNSLISSSKIMCIQLLNGKVLASRCSDYYSKITYPDNKAYPDFTVFVHLTILFITRTLILLLRLLLRI